MIYCEREVCGAYDGREGGSEGWRVSKETKEQRDKTKKWARILMN
jgi:hypothetical protein